MHEDLIAKFQAGRILSERELLTLILLAVWPKKVKKKSKKK